MDVGPEADAGGVPEYFAKFTRKHFCRSLFFSKAESKRDFSSDLLQ